MSNNEEAALAGAAPKELTTFNLQKSSLVENTVQGDSSSPPEKVFHSTDPGFYTSRVASVPVVRERRYIHVTFELSVEDLEDVVDNIHEKFDVKAPRKLIRFLQAIDQPCSEDQRFDIVPNRWWNKTCEVRVILKKWTTLQGEKRERNIIAEYTKCA